MSKQRNVRKRRSNVQSTPRRPWWLWAVAAAAVLLVVAGLTVVLTSGNNTANGQPKLVVEQTVIDEGYQKLDTLVRTTFKIRNEGDGPLMVLGKPQVKLVEGC